jgi:hypothetical protein
MPDRAKIISQLASKAKMDPSSAVKEKDVKAMGEIQEPEGYGMMRKDKIKSIVEPLPTPKDKEAEVEDLLSESEMEMEKKAEYAAKEKANYDRIKKQGMSDQGIVSPEELVAAGKKVYRKVKSKVKSMME